MPISPRLAAVVAALVVIGASLPAHAREPVARSLASSGDVQDVLEAEAAGLVTVRYVPNDSRSAQIIVTNRAKKPLTLRLPAAFAGVPVLAQMGMGGMGGMGGGGAGFAGGGIGGGAQTTGGGGLGQQGMNGMGGMGGMGGGAFSIPPQKTRVLRVTTVCLEYGKPEPSPRYPYKLAEVESFSSDPKLALVLERLGRGELPQKVAQAAAWHLSSGLSWERLAAEKIDHAGGVPDEAYFNPAELLAAHRVVEQVTQAVATRQPAGTSAAVQ
ncbi:MAG: hypothetical protein ACKOEM_06630 [Planctomycetia bacterium]